MVIKAENPWLQVDGCSGTMPAKIANPWLQVDGLPVTKSEN